MLLLGLGFSMGAGDLTSGPHAFVWNTFLTSPKPLLYKLKLPLLEFIHVSEGDQLFLGNDSGWKELCRHWESTGLKVNGTFCGLVGFLDWPENRKDGLRCRGMGEDGVIWRIGLGRKIEAEERRKFWDPSQGLKHPWRVTFLRSPLISAAFSPVLTTRLLPSIFTFDFEKSICKNWEQLIFSRYVSQSDAPCPWLDRIFYFPH